MELDSIIQLEVVSENPANTSVSDGPESPTPSYSPSRDLSSGPPATRERKTYAAMSTQGRLDK